VEVIPSIRAECPALLEVKMMRQFVQENLAEEFKRKQSAFCDMDFFLPRGKATQPSLRVGKTNTQVFRPMLFQSHPCVLVCLVKSHAAKVAGNFCLSNKKNWNPAILKYPNMTTPRIRKSLIFNGLRAAAGPRPVTRSFSTS
jgi:hypothetical protein